MAFAYLIHLHLRVADRTPLLQPRDDLQVCGKATARAPDSAERHTEPRYRPAARRRPGR